MIKPASIHLVILAHLDSHTVNNAMNSGTNAAMMAANPPLIYSTDQVSKPLEIHKRKILWIEILFSTFHLGMEYPFNKKKLTNIDPEINWRRPDTNKPGRCCAPILDAIKVVPQKKLTIPSAK